MMNDLGIWVSLPLRPSGLEHPVWPDRVGGGTWRERLLSFLEV